MELKGDGYRVPSRGGRRSFREKCVMKRPKLGRNSFGNFSGRAPPARRENGEKDDFEEKYVYVRAAREKEVQKELCVYV